MLGLASLSILCIMFLPCILCIMFFASSFASSLTSSLALSLAQSFALSLIRFLSLLQISRSACSLFCITSLDKQSYVELVANQYKCFVGFVWHCNVYLAFRPLRPIYITHHPSIDPSTVSFTTVLLSCVIYSTSFTHVSCFSQTS